MEAAQIDQGTASPSIVEVNGAKYHFSEILHKDSNGAIYRYINPNTGQNVAVKIARSLLYESFYLKKMKSLSLKKVPIIYSESIFSGKEMIIYEYLQYSIAEYLKFDQGKLSL